MAKLTLTDLVNLENEVTAVEAINANSALIEIALENTLSRNGTTPNMMSASLDMNSNAILNLPAATTSTEPIRKAEFDDFVIGEIDFNSIEDLDNLITIQESPVIFEDGTEDVIFGWDESAGTYKNFTVTDILTEASPASGDFILMYGSEGDLRKIDYSGFATSGTFSDATFAVQDNSDATKQLKFEVSGVTTATTRTLTVPDANTTIVGTNVTQTLTNKTLTSPSLTDTISLAASSILNWDASDLTLTHSTNNLTLAGGNLVLPNAGLTIGHFTSVPFSDDGSGLLTLQNIDSLDTTTENTIEAAIDTLLNLSSIQGHTVTLTGALIRSGAHSLTLTTTGTTSLTLPTSGTLLSSTDTLAAHSATTSAQLAGVISDETGSGALVFGTTPSFTTSMLLDSGFIMNWNGSDVTLTHSLNTLTLAGGDLVLPAAGLTVGASIPFSDSAGTLTLQNVDALDATTEATIEASIDTLANLTSVGGKTISFVTPSVDQVFGWDQGTTTFKTMELGDIGTEAAPASGDFVLIYRAEGDLQKVNWSNLPGVSGGLSNVADDLDPALGGLLDANGFSIWMDDNTGINDETGNEQLLFQTTGSAVNFWEMTNASTGNSPLLQSAGSDADVGVKISSKGSGTVQLAINGTNEVVLTTASLSPAVDGTSALGTTSLGWNGLHLDGGTAINWANGEITLTETTDALLTLAGGNLMVPVAGLIVGHSSSIPFSDDGSGALTLQNIDFLDSTTEITIETAIDTLANLTSIGGRTVDFTSDPAKDVLFGWDESVNTYKTLLHSDLSTEAAPAAGDFFVMYTDTGTLVKVDWGSIPSGITDADKGDITVTSSGTVWTIDNDAVTFAKMQDLAADRLIGADTAGSPVEISLATSLEFTGSNSIQRSALTGDVTASAGSNATTIANDAVTYTKMQNVSTTDRLLGLDAAAPADVTEIALSTGLEFSGSNSIRLTSAYQAVGTQGIYIPASAMTPRTVGGSGGPTLVTTESTTNDIMMPTMDFDTSTVEAAQFTIALPKQWNEGTVTFRAYWTAASGSGTVAFSLAGRSFANDDAIDQAVGSAVICETDTLITANDVHVTAISAAITLTSAGADELQVFQVVRETGSDTLSVDAKLIGIELLVVTDAANDT